MSKKQRKRETLTDCVRRKYHRPGNGLLQTEAEIAAALGEEIRTIRHWRHSGVIHPIVMGYRTIRYRLEDVLKALERRTVKPV
jgi:Helix-turn-helix domain